MTDHRPPGEGPRGESRQNDKERQEGGTPERRLVPQREGRGKEPPRGRVARTYAFWILGFLLIVILFQALFKNPVR
jgi:hypothetical protein